MALKEIANANATVKHGGGSPVSSGVFSIVTAPSVKVKPGGQGAHRGTIMISLTGGNADSLGCTPASVATGAPGVPAPQPLSGSALKVRADSMAVVRKGDTANLLMWCVNLASGLPVTIGPQPVEMDDPGQTKVTGE